MMMFDDDEEPKINLKLSFDNIPEGIYRLLTVLCVLLIIFLFLRIIDLIITKFIKLNNYIKYKDYNSILTSDM